MPGAASVLDASVVLALIYDEPGASNARPRLPTALMSTVNAAEVMTILMRRGVPESVAREALERLGVTMQDFTLAHAAIAARLHEAEARRISLGDRACLATAFALGVSAVTADRNWRGLDLPVKVEFIR